jgi:hypothetical protein
MSGQVKERLSATAKAWAMLGLVNLLAALGIFVHQYLRYKEIWNWQQFLHHETFMALFGGIGLVLLYVAVVSARQGK